MTQAEIRFPKFFLYMLVGCVVALVYFMGFSFAQPVIGAFYAVTLAYVLAVSTHFLLNNFVTFRSQGARITHRKIARYAVVLAVNYLVSSAVVLTLLSLGAPSAIALGGGIAATTAIGFVLSRWWVFHAPGH